MKPSPTAADAASSAASAPLPDLRIVPSPAVLLHEDCDPERVERLGRRLDAEGVLRNPPIVAAIETPPGSHGTDGPEYVVLDGANRVTALQQAGVPHQAVQVVAYDDPALLLDVWSHLLRDDGELARAGASGWQAQSVEQLRAGLRDGRLDCGLLMPSGAWGLPAAGGLPERVRALAGIVAAYKGRTPIYRVQGEDLDALTREFGGAGALVRFPRLTKGDITAIARLPVKLPTGISRHVVPLRALRVNVDLALLRAGGSTADKQARLDALIRERLLQHRVRHYPESTVLFDE